jgi:hypothetical protein
MEEKEGDGHQVCEQEGIGVGRGECNRGHPNIEDLVLSRNSNYQYMYIKKNLELQSISIVWLIRYCTNSIPQV